MLARIDTSYADISYADIPHAAAAPVTREVPSPSRCWRTPTATGGPHPPAEHSSISWTPPYDAIGSAAPSHHLRIKWCEGAATPHFAAKALQVRPEWAFKWNLQPPARSWA